MKQENHLKQNFLKISILKKPKIFLNKNRVLLIKFGFRNETNKKSPTGPLLLQLYNKKQRKLYLPVGITMQLAFVRGRTYHVYENG
jgi:hypothetical protein